jgi:hypothetical protein
LSRGILEKTRFFLTHIGIPVYNIISIREERMAKWKLINAENVEPFAFSFLILTKSPVLPGKTGVFHKNILGWRK